MPALVMFMMSFPLVQPLNFGLSTYEVMTFSAILIPYWRTAVIPLVSFSSVVCQMLNAEVKI
jgi:hypothetical protein